MSLHRSRQVAVEDVEKLMEDSAEAQACQVVV